MESNSSKNSHGRDYWGNQQVSERSEGKSSTNFNLFRCFRLQARRRVARIKRRPQATRDEARRLRKAAQVAPKAFRRTSGTLSEQMEAQLRQRCRQMQCWREVGQLTSQRCLGPTN